MALSEKKLYFRKNGTTYSCNLYNSVSDVGSSHIAFRHSSSTLYAKLGEVSNPNASYLRVYRGGVKAVLTTAVTAPSVVWTPSSGCVPLCPACTADGQTVYSGDYFADGVTNGSRILARSTNGGSSWSTLATYSNCVGVRHVSVSPNGTYVTVLVHLKVSGVNTYHVYTSRNGGASFVGPTSLGTSSNGGQYTLTTNQGIHYVALFYDNAQLYRSSDGSTFTGVLTLNAVNPCDMKASSDGTLVYFGGYNPGFWKSSNSGVSFTQLYSSPSIGAVNVSSDGQKIFAHGSSTVSKKSVDAGATWTDAAIPSGGYGSAVGTANLDKMFYSKWVAGAGIKKSVDGGATWTDLVVGGLAYHLAYSESADTLYYPADTAANSQLMKWVNP